MQNSSGRQIPGEGKGFLEEVNPLLIILVRRWDEKLLSPSSDSTDPSTIVLMRRKGTRTGTAGRHSVWVQKFFKIPTLDHDSCGEYAMQETQNSVQPIASGREWNDENYINFISFWR